MQEHEKNMLTLLLIGAVIALAKMLVSNDPITPRLVAGRVILGSAVSMIAGAALIQFPDLPNTAINGIGCALGILGYQFVEGWLRRRGSKWMKGEDNDAQ